MAMTGPGRRRLMALVTTAVCGVALLGLPAAGRAAIGDLSFDSCLGGSTGCSAVGGNVLENASAVAVSPNGNAVYVTGHDPLSVNANPLAEAAVSVFTTAANGAPSFDSCISDHTSGGHCVKVGVPGNPLERASAIVVSPNGRSIYVAAEGDPLHSLAGDVVHLFADPATGRMAWDGCVSDDGSDAPDGINSNAGTCASAGRNALYSPDALAVSPNGGSLYVGADTPPQAPDFAAVSHLFANPDQGQLTYDGCVSDSGDSGACTDVPGTGDPLDTANGVAVSPTGGSLYVAGQTGISHLFADPVQGQLTYDGCVGDVTATGVCTIGPSRGQPLTDLDAVAVNPAGTSVYTYGDDTEDSSDVVSHLFANAAQGQLTWDGCVSNDGSAVATGACADVPGTASPIGGNEFGVFASLTVSPDGKTLYLATPSNDTVTWFAIASPGGQLTFQGCVSDMSIAGCSQVPAGDLAGADGVAVSPDGNSVYVVGADNGTLVHFVRSQVDATGTGTGTGTTGTGGTKGGTGTTGTGSGAGGGEGATGATATGTVAGHAVTLTGPSRRACLARTAKLTLTLTAQANTGGAQFAHAQIFLDRGRRVVHHQSALRHGHKVILTTVLHLANRVLHTLPAHVSLSLRGLASGAHVVRARVVYTAIVHRNGRSVTRTFSKSLKLRFRVC
jgi:hypothetical protein